MDVEETRGGGRDRSVEIGLIAASRRTPGPLRRYLTTMTEGGVERGFTITP